MPAYDAFLLVSFGGPEGPDDVLPFLANVTRGRNIPPERLAGVAEHYLAVGGVSPINQQCRDLLAAVRADFAANGLSLPLYWGNRNWAPYLADTVQAMADAGVQRAVAFVTSAYSSYSSCRQYLDDIEQARAAVGPAAPRIDKIRRFFNHPGFIEPFAGNVRAALATLPAELRDDAHLVFTAHSVPLAMAEASGPPGDGGRYVAELTEAARLIAERTGAGAHPPRSSTRAGAGRHRSPGWNLTCVTTSASWPSRAPRPWSWSRSASSRTIWRSGTIWTWRRPRPPAPSAWRSPVPPRPVPARASPR